MIDYHIHTALCGHAKGEISEYCQQAVKTGLTEIGFADHFPFNYEARFSVPVRELTMPEIKISEYLELIDKVKRDNTKLEIKKGFEVDYYPKENLFYNNYLKIWDEIDYVIGSVHFLDEWGFDQVEYGFKIEEFGISKLWQDYFEAIKSMIAQYGNYIDIIGHLDLPKKLGWLLPELLNEQIFNILKLIKDRELILEINTSGLDRPVKEIYPSMQILKWAFEKGIEITTGSDAHNPQEVGRYFSQAKEMLTAIGFKKLVVLNNHKKHNIKL